MFLASIDEPVPDRVEIALGALQDDRLLIGVAVLAGSADDGIGLVAVHPARRRLGVGTDLVLAILDEAAARHLGRVSAHPGRLTPAGVALLASVGLISTVRSGWQRSQFAIPAAYVALASPEGVLLALPGSIVAGDARTYA